MIAAAVVIGGILAVGGGLALWKYRAVQAAKLAPPPPEMPNSVVFTTVTTAKWQSTADLVGTALAKRSVTVRNEVAGRIEDIKFESGAIVEQGAVLLTFESSQERADLAAEEAAIKVAEADVKVADARIAWGDTNLRRMTQAVEGKVASESELDKARTDLDQYRAELERAKAAVVQAHARADQVRTLIDKKTIVAPFKARAGLRNIHPGQYLAEGSDVVMLQSIEDTINLDFAIPQEHLFRVHLGEKVMATSSLFGEEPFPITVVAVDAAANPSTRNVRVRGEVANPDQRLRPGMSVDIRVPIGGVEEYVVIPSMAVRRSSFGDHVFLIGPGSKPGDDEKTSRATQRFVTLGPSLGTQTIVLKGLAAGDTIAADGSFKLQDGAKVFPALAPGVKPAEPGQTGGEKQAGAESDSRK